MRITPNGSLTLKRPFLKKSALALAIAALAIIAAPSFGVYWWTVGRYIETSQYAYVRADIVSVSARVPGDVVSVAVQDNQSVHKGQLLARLDDAEYQARVIRARADVAVAVAALRADAVMTGQTVVGRQGPQDSDDHRDAQRDVVMTRAQAQVDVAQAALELAQRDLARTAIYATTDGVISDGAARAGQHVVSGQPLMTVVPLDTLYVMAHFKEGDLATMHPGQRAEIDINGYSGTTLGGHVASIAPGLAVPSSASRGADDVATGGRGIPVKIAFDNASIAMASLRNGMAVDVRVHTDDGRNAAR